MRNGGAKAVARQQLLADELRRISAVLAGRADVVRVIVFGSVAGHRVQRGSDLDLIVVQRTDKRFLDRLDEMYRLLVPRVACDILVYTPDEFASLQTESRFVARAVREGTVVHAA
ncbi:MAG: nucleotidyltransferase domain-containing protein [Deltaproteobacteria bacterium]|nr:nucleotidyltransferase domain-containing protein [Deltaproteobacteria bacterium]